MEQSTLKLLIWGIYKSFKVVDAVAYKKKSCAILNFAHFDSLICIVARSREKSHLLLIALAYRSNWKLV